MDPELKKELVARTNRVKQISEELKNARKDLKDTQTDVMLYMEQNDMKSLVWQPSTDEEAKELGPAQTFEITETVSKQNLGKRNLTTLITEFFAEFPESRPSTNPEDRSAMANWIWNSRKPTSRLNFGPATGRKRKSVQPPVKETK
jgi:hypothetical protein